MRSKLAISALVVASLFGSTLIASAQNQTAPGASSEGNVSPRATSGKKTQHEKGMTTGSSRRSGANKGDAVNPSGQGNADPDTESGVGPKSGGSIDIFSRGGWYLREQRPRNNPGPYF